MQRIVLQKGQRFGRLEVDSFVGVSAHGKSLYRCVCDCGEETIAIVSELKNGHKKSCGCLFVEMRAEGAGPKTIVKHFPWLNEEKLHTVDEVIQHADGFKNKYKVCDRIVNGKNILDRNVALMQLKDTALTTIAQLHCNACLQTEKIPMIAAVSGSPHAVADRRTLAVVAFAFAHINYVLIGRRDRH